MGLESRRPLAFRDRPRTHDCPTVILYIGLSCIIAGVAIALFPSNYEIVGMEDLEDAGGEADARVED